MTLAEFGGKLRIAKPKLKDVALPDAQLAQYFLNLYPEYYDIISPNARKIKDLSETPIYYESRRWLEGSDLTGKNEAQAIANRNSHIELLHKAEMTIEASSRGVPLECYAEIVSLDHKHKLQIELMDHQYELEKKKDNDALNVGNRELLTAHELVDDLEDKLMKLIDRHDAEVHPMKKQVLFKRIQRLMEELDGRSTAEAVQAKNRAGLGSEDQETDEQGDNRAKAEGNMESVSAKKPRMGFGRGDDTN